MIHLPISLFVSAMFLMGVATGALAVLAVQLIFLPKAKAGGYQPVAQAGAQNPPPRKP